MLIVILFCIFLFLILTKMGGEFWCVFPQNKQEVIDDFKKHIEVLKRILKDDDEIIPFDKIEAAQSEIFVYHQPDNTRYEKIFSDELFGVSIEVEKNTKKSSLKN